MRAQGSPSDTVAALLYESWSSRDITWFSSRVPDVLRRRRAALAAPSGSEQCINDETHDPQLAQVYIQAGWFDATSGPDGAFFLGDAEVAAKLRRVSEQLGVDRVSLQMTNTLLAHTELLRGIKLLGTEVAPRVADL